MTADELRTYLGYDPETGFVTWRVTNSNRCKVGTRAGTPSHGYRQIRLNGRITLEHRIIWALVHGCIPAGMEIDHINGIGHDNRLCNLRLADRSQNAQNKTSAQSTSLTGVQGVKYDRRRRKFIARIKCLGVEKYLGQFDNAADAHAAYVAAKRVLHSHNTL